MADKGEKTREKILDKATGVFLRKGFGASSINDLLQAAQVTRGSLYFHFAGKEAVALAVLRREAETFLDFIDAALTGSNPAACLDNFFRKALGKHQATGFVGGCLFGNTALEASDSCPSYARLVDEVFLAWVEKIEDKITAAQVAGLVRRDVPARQLAATTVAVIEGGIMQSRLQKSPEPMRECLATLRTLLELKLHH